MNKNHIKSTIFQITLILFAHSAHVTATPDIREMYIYYEIQTTAVTQLLPDLNANSPIRQDGKIFHGYTHADVSWNFTWVYAHNNCRINKVTTRVDVQYTLPRLSNIQVEDNLTRVWQQWYPALIKHEQGHADFAKSTAILIEREIMDLPGSHSCKILERDANKTGNELMARLQQLHLAYDLRTHNGETQGASLFTYLN